MSELKSALIHELIHYKDISDDILENPNDIIKDLLFYYISPRELKSNILEIEKFARTFKTTIEKSIDNFIDRITKHVLNELEYKIKDDEMIKKRIINIANYHVKPILTKEVKKMFPNYKLKSKFINRKK